MQAHRGQPDNRVAWLDAAEPLEGFDLHHAHDRSREIEMRRAHRAPASRRFRRRATRIVKAAGFARNRDDFGRDGRIEFPDREVIQKEERRRVADEDVVDAMIDQIGADRRVPSKLGCNHDLRADAVGRGNQRAAGVARHAKKPRKAADRVELAGVTPLAQHRTIARDGFVSGANVNAGSRVAVRTAFFLCTRILPAFCHRLAVVHHRKGPPCKFV